VHEWWEQMTCTDLDAELERLHPAGFAWALACCRRDREEAQDVLQTSYLKILDGRARFDGRSALKTFLFAVIRRTAAEVRRRERARAFLLARWAPFRAPAPQSEASPGGGSLPLAVGQLARRQREIVELVFGHDLSIAEAARVMGVSLGSARVHYDRAKKRLARVLSEEEKTS